MKPGYRLPLPAERALDTSCQAAGRLEGRSCMLTSPTRLLASPPRVKTAVFPPRWAWIAALLLNALPAAAQSSPGVALRYEPGPLADRCPSLDAVQNAVSARLGFSPFQPRPAWNVTASIAAQGDGLVGTIELYDASGKLIGKREITSSPDCEALVEAIAVGISVALEPLVVPPVPQATSEPAEAPAPEPAKAPPPPSEPAQVKPRPVEPAAKPVQWAAQLGPQLIVGLTPSLVPAIAAQLSGKHGNLSLGLEGHASMPTDESVPNGSVRTSLLTASLLPCGHSGPWMGCAVLTMGSLRAEGRDLDMPRQGQALVAAAGVRTGLSVSLSRVVFASLHGELSAALTQTTVLIDGRDQWTSPPFWGGFGLGFGAVCDGCAPLHTKKGM